MRKKISKHTTSKALNIYPRLILLEILSIRMHFIVSPVSLEKRRLLAVKPKFNLGGSRSNRVPRIFEQNQYILSTTFFRKNLFLGLETQQKFLYSSQKSLSTALSQTTLKIRAAKERL